MNQKKFYPPIQNFDILIINLNTDDHPIYKAVSISGFGSGYGNSIEEAKEDLKLQINRLLQIVVGLKMDINHTLISDFRSKNNPKLYGLSGWESESVIWDSVRIQMPQ